MPSTLPYLRLKALPRVTEENLGNFLMGRGGDVTYLFSGKGLAEGRVKYYSHWCTSLINLLIVLLAEGSYGSLTSRLHLRCTCTCTLYLMCAYASGLNLPAAYIPGSPAALVLPTYRCAGRSTR
ncbi:hypothetical protein J6590_103923 [Homalodisca vitripennis]|nr:hypothetical protein J6590_103923 [Homalodisca vitripennis]